MRNARSPNVSWTRVKTWTQGSIGMLGAFRTAFCLWTAWVLGSTVPSAATDPLLLPRGLAVHGALYSQHHGVVMLRLDGGLLIYDPRTSRLQTIHLPEPTLSFTERDGDVVVGSETGIHQVDIRRAAVTGRFASPVPVQEVALGDGYVAVVQADDERQGVWKLPFRDSGNAFDFGEAVFSALPIENRGVLRQGERGPLLFNRWLSSVGFRHLAPQDSGRLGVEGCPQFYGARSRNIWPHRDHVFLDSGHKLDLTRQECASNGRQEVRFATRLPVRQVADLCVGPGWVALIQEDGAPNLASEADGNLGHQLEVIADPLPKRLASLPLPSLRQPGGDRSWGRFVACDGPGRRVFVILQDTWWNDGGGTWGMATFDISPLQDEIEKSRAWAKLVR